MKQCCKGFKLRMLWILRPRVSDLSDYEQKIFSQHGEDGILKIILHHVGATNRFCVEFGVEDGRECNTRYLIEREGWHCLHMDGQARPQTYSRIEREFVTAENVCALFGKYDVPEEFDVLSLDIDYNTYWVWHALEGYRPRIVVVEYNASLGPTESKAVEYDPLGVWDGTDYYGASLAAYAKLGKGKGYTLIGCESQGVNAFFVRDDVLGNRFSVPNDVREIYRPPQYGVVIGGEYRGHPASHRPFVDV